MPQNLFAAFWWIDPLPVLDLQPVLGRAFTADEISSREPVATTSERVWGNRFAGDEDLIGSTIPIGDDPCTLIGVTSRPEWQVQRQECRPIPLESPTPLATPPACCATATSQRG